MGGLVYGVNARLKTCWPILVIRFASKEEKLDLGPKSFLLVFYLDLAKLRLATLEFLY